MLYRSQFRSKCKPLTERYKIRGIRCRSSSHITFTFLSVKIVHGLFPPARAKGPRGRSITDRILNRCFPLLQMCNDVRPWMFGPCLGILIRLNDAPVVQLRHLQYFLSSRDNLMGNNMQYSSILSRSNTSQFSNLLLSNSHSDIHLYPMFNIYHKLSILFILKQIGKPVARRFRFCVSLCEER